MKALFIIYLLLIGSISSYCQKSPVDSTDEMFIRVEKMWGQENLGKKMVTFNAIGLDGKKYSSDDFAGKITFVNFWFEACHPCLAEFGALNNLYEGYKGKKEFQFYSFTYETKENAERIAKEHDLKYPVILISYDSSHIMNLGQGFPTNMVIDKKGNVHLILTGGPIDPMIAREVVDKIIKPDLDLLLKD